MPSVSDAGDTYVNRSRGDEFAKLFPNPPLHFPIHLPNDPTHINLFDRVRPRYDTRRKQNSFLDLRGQVGQPHDSVMRAVMPWLQILTPRF